MRNLSCVVGLAAALAVAACKKEEAKPAAGSAVAPAAGSAVAPAAGSAVAPAAGSAVAPAAGSAAAPAAGSAAAPAAGAADAVICCEFGGAKGTSTAALCEQSKGKVVPNDQCPGMK